MVAALAPSLPPPVIEITPEGKLRYNLHEGQQRAFWSEKRFVLVLAGLQSGKTTIGPIWLLDEMRRCGPGDYLAGSPTFTLLELRALPEFKRLFVDLLGAGTYQASPVRVFTLSERGEVLLWGKKQDVPTRVLFGHAQDPESLESATFKAAWLDEAGQKKFRFASWVAIQGRLAVHQGRCLFTTTAYVLGWLKSEIHDPWVAAKRDHPDIEVVSFESTMNPAFPRAEFERMRAILPAWMFDMRYRGRFTRPAGMIYDCWSDDENIVAPFEIPESWPRFLGLDFGGVNTAGLFVARELDAEGRPTGRHIGYREYHAGGRTARQHAAHLVAGEPKRPTAVGGSKSEGQWRQEFSAGGLGVHPPDQADVEVGILRVYGAIKTREFVVFSTLTGFIEQVRTYTRPLDERGEPMEGIEDKEIFHLLDCARYILGWLRRPGSRGGLS